MKDKTTLWEQFTIDGVEYRRRCIFDNALNRYTVEWQVQDFDNDRSGGKNYFWTIKLKDYNGLQLENMYNEFIQNETRENKLKRILKDD